MFKDFENFVALAQELIQVPRWMHQQPEAGVDERATCKPVAEILREYGYAAIEGVGRDASTAETAVVSVGSRPVRNPGYAFIGDIIPLGRQPLVRVGGNGAGQELRLP